VKSPQNGSLGIIQYGHGLFDNYLEIQDDYLQVLSNEHGYVLFSTDYWGLCENDELTVTAMIAADLSDFPIVPDRSQQGVLNQLVLSRLLTGPSFYKDPIVIFNNISVIERSKIFYYGNSAGSILGTVFLAMTQDMTRGVLGVGGAPFGLLLPRSKEFTIYFDLVKLRYLNPIDRSIMMNTLQLLWERAEASGYMDAITGDPLPDTPVKTVLMNYGLGDAQVSWLGCHTLARSLNSSMFSGNVREDYEILFGFGLADSTNGATSGSVVVGFNFSAPTVPQTNIPPNSSFDTHECTRRDPRGMLQIHTFFSTGVIVDPCGNDGCNPIVPPIHLSSCPLPD